MLSTLTKQVFRKILPVYRGQWVVGLGNFCKQFPQKHGCDRACYLSHRVDDRCQHTDDIHWVQADLFELPLLGNAVDLFLLSHTLKDAGSRQHMVVQVYDAQAAGGFCVVACVSPWSVFGLLNALKPMRAFCFMSPRKCLRLFEGVGYTALRVERRFGVYALVLQKRLRKPICTKQVAWKLSAAVGGRMPEPTTSVMDES